MLLQVLTGKATAIFLSATVLSTGAAAATGNLPAPMQHTLESTLSHVGVELSSPDSSSTSRELHAPADPPATTAPTEPTTSSTTSATKLEKLEPATTTTAPTTTTTTTPPPAEPLKPAAVIPAAPTTTTTEPDDGAHGEGDHDDNQQDDGQKDDGQNDDKQEQGNHETPRTGPTVVRVTAGKGDGEHAAGPTTTTTEKKPTTVSTGTKGSGEDHRK